MLQSHSARNFAFRLDARGKGKAEFKGSYSYDRVASTTPASVNSSATI
jgi:hypothetical protein